MVDRKLMNQERSTIEERKEKRSGRRKVLETAVFLDYNAYRKFSDYFYSIGKNHLSLSVSLGKFCKWSVPGKSDVDTEVKRLVLSYMNGIQAIYLLPSLQQEIDISIVRLEMWTHARAEPYNNYQASYPL